MKKKVSMHISLMLAMIMCITPLSAYAATPSNERAEISESFIATCDLVFSGKGEVFNSEGIEITQNFVNTYHNTYSMGDYAAILEACYDIGVSRICAHGEKVEQTSPRAYMILSYEEYVTHFVTQEGIPYDGKSWYFTVTATGTYRYLDGYNQIQEVYEPLISVSYIDIGSAFTGSLVSIRTSNPVISSDKSYATFNVTTAHTVSCPLPGLDYTSGTMGPFTHVSYFTIDPIS